MKRKIIYIQWYDAYTTSGWRDPHKLLTGDRGMCCESVGVLLEQTKNSIKIVQSVSESESVSDMITIPLPWVKKVEVLGYTEDFKDDGGK